MNNKEFVISEIQAAFINNEYPGDNLLQGSFEGSEPFEEIEPFMGQKDWMNTPSPVLDNHAGALNFFSEAGFRYFLPAYLVADINNELMYADPLFHLIHGFSEGSVEHVIGTRVFVRKIGKSAFVNPRRYGGMTFYDYARYRLSIFTREEARAIVAYLKYKMDRDPEDLNNEEINEALNSFWLERTEIAPPGEIVAAYMQEEEEYIAAISSQSDESG
ncbi:MAG: hypothetical protein ABUK20_13515 [Anaerolineales bacterium]